MKISQKTKVKLLYISIIAVVLSYFIRTGPLKVTLSQETFSTPETCIFLLTTPGSGSSTMRELVSQCMEEGCTMSGENWGALKDLSNFNSKLEQTYNQEREEEHAEAAWRMYFNYDDVQDAAKNVVTTMLNPFNKKCWGFKEIRYGNGPFGIADDVKYLQSLCDNPKIILHTRDDVEKERYSTVIYNIPKRVELAIRQHKCFDSFVGEPTTEEILKGCEKTSTPESVFRFYLEDYIEGTERYSELWDFLGCSAPLPPSKTINMSTKKDKEEAITGNS